MASNKGRGFEGDAEGIAGNIRKAAKGTYDIAQNLGKAKESWNAFSQSASDVSKTVSDLNQKLSETKAASIKAFQNASENAVELSREVINLKNQIEKMNKKLLAVRGFENLNKGFDKLGSSLLNVHKTIMSFGFSFLIDSIKDVYELQERWTRAMGEFNMKIGGTSAGLKGAAKAAGQWSSQVRGLTGGDIQEGIQLFGEFTMGMSRMVESGDEFSKFGLQLARGFNLGGEAAGRLTRTFENMNMSAGQSSVVMSDLSDAAGAMHVPVNLVAKDVAEANDYMARFGKEGAKAFVKGAAYARKFGMSIKDIQKSVEGFDGLEEAVTTTAKFNVAFGTSINGIDMLLEDDPAKRMETLRKALLAQGLTYDNMLPKQRLNAAQMLKVNESQLAALLKSGDAGFSYQKMLDENAKKEKSEIASKALMQKALHKTAQTMFAFGAAWDRITTAIGKAIKPLLEVLGLAKTGEKDFKGFGSVMSSIFGTIEHFFNELAGNKKWEGFMRELALDMKAAGAALKDWIMSGGAVKLVGKIVSVTRELYRWGKDAFAVMVDGAKKLQPYIEWIFSHSKEILAVWAGMKASNAVGGFAQKLAGSLNIEGVSADGKTKTTTPTRAGNFASKAGGVLSGAVMGAGIGAVTGGGSAAGSIGGALGGALGSLGGPIGMAVGAAVGGWLADQAVNLVETLWPKKLSKLDQNLMKEKDRGIQLDKQRSTTAKNLDILETQMSSSRRTFDLKKMEEDAKALEAVKGNKNATNELVKKQKEYWDSLEALRDQADKQNKLDVEKFASKQRIDNTDLEIKKAELEVQRAKEEKDYQGSAVRMTSAEQEALFLLSNKEKLRGRDEMTSAEKTRLDKLRKLDTDDRRIKQAAIDRETKANIELTNLNNKKKQQELEMMEFQSAQITKQIVMDAELSSERYKSFRKANISMSEDKAQELYLRTMMSGESGAEQALKYFDLKKKVLGMASGGIVSSPTRALIGENGPEAVIPLRSMARGRANMPRKFGGSAAKSLVNYAAGANNNASQSNQIQFVAGDVYLDGNIVGRHLVRSALSGR